MSETMSAPEADARAALARSVDQVARTVRRLPTVDSVLVGRVPAVTEMLDEALSALSQAESATETLAGLTDASTEAMLLATNSTMAIAMIRHSLALVCAELDMKLAG